MSDTLDNETETTVIIAGGIPGPVTMVKVAHCGKAEVMLPVNPAIFDEMVAFWTDLAKEKGFSRNDVKDSIIRAFAREDYLGEKSVQAIIGGVLYVVATGDATGALKPMIERGGALIVSSITDEGGGMYGHRTEIHAWPDRLAGRLETVARFPHRRSSGWIPSPSDNMAMTSVLRLTPSRRARSTNRRCSDLGTRCCHLPLNASSLEMEGGGIGRPASLMAAIQHRTASVPFTTASSTVSPSDRQPGRSGYSTRNPPPSSSPRGRTVNG